MALYWTFVVCPVLPGRKETHLPLLFGDLERLQELFPNSPVWQARQGDTQNAYVFYLTREVAGAFYDALTEFRSLEEPSAVPYVAGGLPGLGMVLSSLRAVFDALIPFFEHELGFGGWR